MAGTPVERHAAAIRTGARQGFAGPTLALVYTLATWDGAHRPVMAAVALGAVAVCAVLWWQADAVAGAPPMLRSGLRWAGSAINLVALTVLTALGGGVAGPLGILLPAALVFFASVTPPPQFLVIAALGAAGYWSVALLGEPVALGYPIVYTLAFGGVSYLCLTHAGALVSLRWRLATVSRVDPLTHCLNRRGTEERLTAEIAEAERTGTPLAVVLADLDGFKAVNDTYGHQTGDDLLAWTARTLARVVRGSDVVGRIGGDEFAVILTGVDADQAGVVAGRLRDALDGVAPASVGYACFPADGRTVPELAQVADARTYQDKVGRLRTPPTPAAVAGARAEVGRRRTVKVSPHERRRRSIADMGWVAISNFSVGLLYIAFFTADSPHRAPLAVLDVAGIGCGVVLVAAAQRLSRSKVSLRFLMGSAVVTFSVGAAVAVLDGGVGSPLALGTLTPIPLIALGTPVRVAVPVITGVAGLYVGIGVLGGTPSWWYLAANLAAVLGASVVCGVQGRTAAVRRRLLTQLTRRDPLTEALNRRGFEEEFAARAGRPLALLIFDLDGFKQVNDVRGHAAGDELLRWVAATLTEQVGPDDVVGRLGGDEFVVLLAGDPAPVAQRLRAALARRTAVSVGTAVLGAHGTDFDALYAHADAALYRQKAARRAARHDRGRPPVDSDWSRMGQRADGPWPMMSG